MVEDRDNLRPSELKNLLGQLGEKAEKTPRPKGEVLREVQAEQRRKTRKMLVVLGICTTIMLILFAIAWRKFWSQF